MNGFSLWPPEKVQITHGAEQLGTYHKTENSHRQWCKTCGGHVMTRHPGMQLIDVYAAILPTLKFTPGLHVFYGESVLRIADGLPKFKDVPAEMGGSGTTLPE